MSGLAIGVAAGLYVHAWWGAGLFVGTTVVLVLAIVTVSVLVVGAVALMAVSLRQRRPRRARTSAALAVALVAGLLAGAMLGPGYRGVATFAGTITVHVTAPTATDWSWQAICMTNENSSEVSHLLAGDWSVTSAMVVELGFLDTGVPAFKLGNEGNWYDSLGHPRARLEVRRLDAQRVAGDVGFLGLPTDGRGFLAAFPGQALDGSLAWACDPTAPAR